MARRRNEIVAVYRGADSFVAAALFYFCLRSNIADVEGETEDTSRVIVSRCYTHALGPRIF